ncbi:glycosyltransferase family 2 protein [Flavobacterium jejuense]|uniref:Glycosyltransferase family 2 protein n=1 Tax=Flavobacterium jejuense TaxID=1544455 RepID=A0ABX0J0R6_9FLAO|nr:glycosyltransferase family 2 protein [Flavobacterium jejuense]NHN27806.1 glycosyltransferase family 2 protein [Flavobacterium jejuense]
MLFSFIIPVYNRPDEIDELLQSLTLFDFDDSFEVVVVEDGSTIPCHAIIDKYIGLLDIAYYFKPNSGPGNSRNFGMQKAKGDYFIILDSDCILPEEYLKVISYSLKNNFVDCFGGPDKALDTFSTIQKAINFSMTSFLTTGGIRGGSEKVDKFQPRSFNMGLSKEAFEVSKGFGNIHPGEDPDLSIRLWELGFSTKLIKEGYVYHKRRIDWKKFYTQVNKFGKARPILNLWYPKYAKMTFWFPSLFLLGFIFSCFLVVFSIPYLFFFFLIYFGMIFVSSLLQNKSVEIAFYSIVATSIQFYGYGIGFLKSFINLFVLKRQPEKAHPELFF